MSSVDSSCWKDAGSAEVFANGSSAMAKRKAISSVEETVVGTKNVPERYFG